MDNSVSKETPEFSSDYPCDECNWILISPKQLKKHQQQSHSNMTCFQCNYVATSKLDLSKHLLQHKQKKALPIALSNNILTGGMTNERGGTEHDIPDLSSMHHITEYSCNQCNWVLISPRQLKKHQDQMHGSGINNIPRPLSNKKIVTKETLDKLEKSLAECAKQIKKLDNSEVNWDDDDDSSYVMTSKYKKRYLEIYKKIARIKKTSADIGRKCDTKFCFNESKYPEVNTKIAKFINRTKIFPDFNDICIFLNEVNEKNKLLLTRGQQQAEAEKIFKKIGTMLKTRRMADDADVIESYISQSKNILIDPADVDSQLEEKLQKQFRQGKKKLDKVFEQFAKKSESETENGEKEEEIETEFKTRMEGSMNPMKRVKLMTVSEVLPSEVSMEEYTMLEEFREEFEPVAVADYKGENNELYCYCQSPHDDVSEMIGCDAPDCRLEWFHFECVGIVIPPEGKWYCPECTRRYGLG